MFNQMVVHNCTFLIYILHQSISFQYYSVSSLLTLRPTITKKTVKLAAYGQSADTAQPAGLTAQVDFQVYDQTFCNYKMILHILIIVDSLQCSFHLSWPSPISHLLSGSGQRIEKNWCCRLAPEDACFCK